MAVAEIVNQPADLRAVVPGEQCTVLVASCDKYADLAKKLNK